MSLLDLAKADHASIVSDTVSGFSQLLTLINPQGLSVVVAGLAADVGQTVDPDTGVMIVGRRVTVSLLTGPLRTSGIGEPRGIADAGSKPWVVRFADAHGNEHAFKVIQAMPDYVLGRVDCLLEAYRG